MLTCTLTSPSPTSMKKDVMLRGAMAAKLAAAGDEENSGQHSMKMGPHPAITLAGTKCQTVTFMLMGGERVAWDAPI